MGRADVLTVGEAAEKLGIGLTLAYKLARANKIPCLRLGRRLLIPRAALEEFLIAPARKDTIQDGEPE